MLIRLTDACLFIIFFFLYSSPTLLCTRCFTIFFVHLRVEITFRTPLYYYRKNHNISPIYLLFFFFKKYTLVHTRTVTTRQNATRVAETATRILQAIPVVYNLGSSKWPDSSKYSGVRSIRG